MKPCACLESNNRFENSTCEESGRKLVKKLDPFSALAKDDREEPSSPVSKEDCAKRCADRSIRPSTWDQFSPGMRVLMT